MRSVRVLLAITLCAGFVGFPPQTATAQPDWAGPLSTRGRSIVDANGARFKLKSGTWPGASETLTRSKLNTIIDGFIKLGLNSIRLPFSNELIQDTRPVTTPVDPELRGKTPLEIYDAVVQRLTARGFAVILNNDTTTGQPPRQWEDDWVRMARRYAANKRVVGADLSTDEPDWHSASQQAADRILTEANPDLMIFVTGRPTLEPVRNLSHTLVESGKLVYSAHVDTITGPDQIDPQHLRDVLYRQAFFVAAETDNHFTAPVWISLSGGRENTDPKSRQRLEAFVDYLIETDADFAYEPYDGDDWRAPALQRLVNAPAQPAAPARRWSMLTLDHGDFQQSRTIRLHPDWDIGAGKGVCPDGQRLIGLSHTGNRGLCTDSSFTPTGFMPVRGETYVDSDWASGYTKVQCPPRHYVVGYGVRGTAFSSVLCASSASPLSTTGRTLWFDRQDNRAPGGGEFAYGHYKGQCATDEYIAGVAYTSRSGRTPDALLCRKAV